MEEERGSVEKKPTDADSVPVIEVNTETTITHENSIHTDDTIPIQDLPTDSKEDDSQLTSRPLEPHPITESSKDSAVDPSIPLRYDIDCVIPSSTTDDHNISICEITAKTQALLRSVGVLIR